MAQPAAGRTHSPLPPTRFMPLQVAAVAEVGLGAGFSRVGNVAVLQGDDLTTTASGTGFGLNKDNMAEISRRFIAAFGDNYDQIAVFLGFTDRLSQQSLAYQQPVKNAIRGIGLGLFDETIRFGSASGRMESMLNMKRINVYGRDAANDPENDLYSVWAQEAAHRWALYFKYRFPTDTSDRSDLLLRQNAHWAPWVQADASFMDGLQWQDNGDGTFTVVESNKRYGAMDQYAMGLRKPEEVPPFFLLDEFKDSAGTPVTRTSRFARGVKYRAQRIDVTVQDVIRAMGPREPATSPAAEDLRMGVVFLTPPGQTSDNLVGEAFRVETTRAPWDGFYNAGLGGRGKVCTALLHPCRGEAFTFGEPTIVVAGRDAGLAGPGDSAKITVPVVNVGTEPAIASVTVSGDTPLSFAKITVASALLAPGAAGTVTYSASVPAQVACGVSFKLDFQAPGKLGPSSGTHNISFGLQAGPGSNLEDPLTGTRWQVDPDGTDTAKVGAWEWGTPDGTAAFDFTLQPQGAFSGTKAFVTGAAKGDRPEANDVDFDVAAPVVGRTTLQSPPLALAGLVNPRLSYQLHFVAAGFQKEVLVPGTNDAFYVLASLDGGPWAQVDRVPSSLFLGWQKRTVNLASTLNLANAATVRLRFVAEDSDLSETVVEAAVDDVFLLSELPGCGAVVTAPDGGATPPVNPGDNGCSCSLHRRSAPSGGAIFVAAALLLSLQSLKRFSRPKATALATKRQTFAWLLFPCSSPGEKLREPNTGLTVPSPQSL